jgi:hypothetical protein
MAFRNIGIVAAALCLSAGMAFAAPSSRASSSSKDKPVPVEVIPNGWEVLTDEQKAESITELKQFAEDAATKLNRPLKMFETKYFLFYSDLPPAQAANWAGLLDRMYAKLAEMFAVPVGVNIWRGKALVFVFSKKEDYRRYEREMVNTDPGTSDGMCHSFGSGIVKIAFYRQEQELAFAHVLVHESVHGFIHRYRTPVPVPSWANEGLAETIATDLVPQRGRRDEVKTYAREGLQTHQNQMGDFFTADHIVGWQYPVAEELCTFMIQASGKNYVEFIKGIKAGEDPQQCLETRFKAPKDRLIPVFGQWLGVKQLQP